jgi:hypothetical protein
LVEPFDTLLGTELRRAVAVRASEALQDSINEVLRQRDAQGIGTTNEQHPGDGSPRVVTGFVEIVDHDGRTVDILTAPYAHLGLRDADC